MEYVTDLIRKNTKRRPYELIDKVFFLVAHDVGASGSTARNNVDYFKRTANDEYASAHFFVDDKEAIMCIPAFEEAEKAYHVRRAVSYDNNTYGIDSIDGAIGVELCYFAGEPNRTRLAYENYVSLLVDLIIYHNLTEKDILSHESLDETRRTDPNNALKYIGKDFDDLMEDVKMEYESRTILVWEEILEGCLDDPESSIEAIESAIEIANLSNDVGSLEQLKYLGDVIVKVFEYGKSFRE